MWPLHPNLLLLASFAPLTCAQDVASVISLLMGDTSPAPPLGTSKASIFSTCTDLVSLEANDRSVDLIGTDTFVNTDIEAIAWAVCTLGGCTGVGLSPLDSCCSYAISDNNSYLSAIANGTPLKHFPTSANDCLSRYKSAPKTKLASATATPTSSSASEGGSSAAPSTSAGGAGASPTSPSAATSTTSTSSSSSGGGISPNADLFAGSVLALITGLLGYFL